MKWLLIVFIKAWRMIVSPWYGNVCKYYPTCSAYGLEAVQTHGALKGSGLIIWRLLRCNPWSMGGYDPVPGTEAARLWALEQAEAQDGQVSDGQMGEPTAIGHSKCLRTNEQPASDRGRTEGAHLCGIS